MGLNRYVVPLMLALALTAGCQPTVSVPKTYPVKGRVVFQDTDTPVDGNIEFRPKDGNTNASAVLAPDGSFTLRTIVQNQNLEGALEGTYEVSIIVRANPADPQDLRIVKLPTPYVVKADDSNDFTIKIDRPHK